MQALILQVCLQPASSCLRNTMDLVSNEAKDVDLDFFDLELDFLTWIF